MWYEKGLRFKCTGCGKCCTGSPGYVWVNEQEIQEMASFLRISVEDFLSRYTRKVGGRISLLEKKGEEYDCVFLKDRLCQVYGARPLQCRTYPWWPENVRTKGDWKDEALRCEGINHPDAPLISLGEIQKNLTPKNKWCTLYLVRHGQTVWNAEKRYQGSLNSSLTEEGREQAHEAADRLKPLKPQAIYTSPLGRALETAHILASKLEINHSIIEDIREGSFGECEGLTYEECKQLDSFNHFHTLTPEEQYHFPISTDAESRAQIAKRVIPALKEIAKNHPGENIAIVTHGGVLRSLKMAVTRQFEMTHAANGEIARFKATEDHILFEDVLN